MKYLVSKPSILFLHLILPALLFCCLACDHTRAVRAQEPTQEQAVEGGLPYIGFNAKGDLRTAEQVRMADSLLARFPQLLKKKMVIRVAGGTRSQKTFLRDWSEDKVRLWADLQKKHGVRMVYTVNGNDTPENQLKVIRRFMDAGVTFDFLEMMTEYYLPKFRLGKTERPEVTRVVTVEDYLFEILPEYWKVLDPLALPYYVIYAPHKPHSSKKQQEYYNAWNEKMNEALNGKYADRDLHAVLHLYQRGSEPYDYGQISRLRNQMPKGRHIGVTEAGVIDPDKSYEEIAPRVRAHYLGILRELNAGDYFMDQVLYTDYKNDNSSTLHSEFTKTNGLTPKGKAVVDLILETYR